MTYASLFFMLEHSNLFRRELTLSLVEDRSDRFLSSGRSEKTTVFHFADGSTSSVTALASSDLNFRPTSLSRLPATSLKARRKKLVFKNWDQQSSIKQTHTTQSC